MHREAGAIGVPRRHPDIREPLAKMIPEIGQPRPAVVALHGSRTLL
jgi:hypothetical protein